MFSQLERDGEFIEVTSYKTPDGEWKYGFHKDCLNGDGIKCMIINKHGLDQFIEKGYGDRIMVVYIICSTDTRIRRYHNRLGDNPTEKQLAEGFLRLIRDAKDFEEFEDELRHGYGYLEYNGVSASAVWNEDDGNIADILHQINTFVEWCDEE
jgi:hypothetical protein